MRAVPLVFMSGSPFSGGGGKSGTPSMTTRAGCQEKAVGRRASGGEAAEEFVEARVLAEVVEARVYPQVGEADRVLLGGAREPAEGRVRVAEQRADDGELVGRHPLALAVGDDSGEEFARLFGVAARGEDVRLLGARRRRVAGEGPLLLEDGHRVVAHPAHL